MRLLEGLTEEELLEASTMEPEDERCTVGKCPYCDYLRNDLLPNEGGTLRCSDCDSNYEYCGICKEEQSHDDHCRHLFSCEFGEWMGAGTYMAEHSLEYVREVLFLLLDEMPRGFAQALRSGIRSGGFYTWAFGGGGTELNGLPQRYGHWAGIWWGNFLMDIGQGELAEETADAYHWLASLYKTDTRKANNITVRWLDEYIAIERAARAYGRAA